MKAAVITGYGGNEVVEIRDMPRPEPGKGEVLIRVYGASINPVDWKIRNGMLRVLTGRKFPKILGSECAGEVVEIGDGVRRVKPGDRVIAHPGARRLGAYAEFACTGEGNVFPSPENLSFQESSPLPIAGLTALQALRDLGRIEAGRSVLINGASGGVGVFALQIARIFDAKTTAVCSSSNFDLVRDLGADRVIDYKKQDFILGDDRWDIVFDAVSKSSFAKAKRVLTPRGVYIATLPQPSTLINQYLTRFMTRKKARTIMVRPKLVDMNWMKFHIEAGRIRIVIDRNYPLEEIREAFAYSESGRAKGKIVLKTGEEETPREEYGKNGPPASGRVTD